MPAFCFCRRRLAHLSKPYQKNEWILKPGKHVNPCDVHLEVSNKFLDCGVIDEKCVEKIPQKVEVVF